jgi:citrate lyase subunit beta / citryl-CoA lyase
VRLRCVLLAPRGGAEAWRAGADLVAVDPGRSAPAAGPVAVRVRTADELAAAWGVRPAVVIAATVGGADVEAIGARLAVHEAEAGLPDGSTAVVALVATPAALFGLGGYGGLPRLVALGWDADALAAGLGTDARRPDGTFAAPVAAVRAAVLAAAAAAEVAALDTPFPDVADAAGLAAEAAAAAADGFSGKFAADAAQVAAIVAAFTPTAEAVARAEAVVAAVPDALAGPDRARLLAARRLLARA